MVLSGDGEIGCLPDTGNIRQSTMPLFQLDAKCLAGGLIRSAVSCLPESRKNFGMDLLRQVKKFFRGLHPDAFERHLGLAIHYEDPLRSSILSRGVLEQIDFLEVREFRRRLFDEVEQLDDLTRMLWVDLRHNLPADMLMKVDRMSMLHSLEVRVPFLDHQLGGYAFRLPGSVKITWKDRQMDTERSRKRAVTG